jgi:hypothetical protein
MTPPADARGAGSPSRKMQGAGMQGVKIGCAKDHARSLPSAAGDQRQQEATILELLQPVDYLHQPCGCFRCKRLRSKRTALMEFPQMRFACDWAGWACEHGGAIPTEKSPIPEMHKDGLGRQSIRIGIVITSAFHPPGQGVCLWVCKGIPAKISEVEFARLQYLRNHIPHAQAGVGCSYV